MKLGELAFACYIFDNGEYANFLKAAKSLDLNKDEDCVTFIKLLNRHWGCRRPEVSHEKAGRKLKIWHKKWAERLFGKNKNLYKLKQNDLDLAAAAYEELLQCKVKYATKKNGELRSISFGPTTAAKILFFLRPKALPLWDNAIKDKLIQRNSIDGSGKALYKSYLKHAKHIVLDLRKDCEKHGFELAELPRKLNKPAYITIPKLIDEYYWITITRKTVPPAREDLQCWLKWYNREPSDLNMLFT